MKPIQITIEAIDKFSKDIEGPMNKLRKLSQTTTQLGRTMSIGISAPLALASGVSIRAANQFNEVMGDVSTLIPNHLDKIDALKKGVLDLSLAYGKAPVEVARGLYQTISTFEFDNVTKTLNQLDVGTKTAVAGLATVDEALLFLGAVTKAYGDTSVEAMEKAANYGFETVRLGVTTFPQLAEAIQTVSPLAQQMGVDMQEMFGVAATAAGTTGNMGEVTTQMASILTAFIKPTETMKKLFDVMPDISSGQEMVSKYGLVGSLQILEAMASKANITLGDFIGRKEGLLLAFSTLGTQSETTSRKIDEMGKALDGLGALQVAFVAQTTGIGKDAFNFKQMQQYVTILAIKLGDKLAPIVVKLFDKMKPLVKMLIDLPDPIMNIAIGIGAVLAVIGPVLLGFGLLSGAVLQIVAVLPYLMILLTPMLNLLLWIGGALVGIGIANVAAFGVAVIGILAWTSALKSLKDGWTDIIDAFSSKFQILQTLNYMFADIADSIAKITSYIPGMKGFSENMSLAGQGFRLKAEEGYQNEFSKEGTAKRRELVGDVEALKNYYIKKDNNKQEIMIKVQGLPKETTAEVSKGNAQLTFDSIDVGSIFAQ